MNKVTAEDIRANARKHNISKWLMHTCYYCKYRCGYHIDLIADNVIYDNGCDCGFGHYSTISSYEEIADHINMQHNENHNRECLEYWKLN